MKEKISLVITTLESQLQTSPDSQAFTLLEAMKYALLAPGKRIRPILVLAACEMLGGKVEDALPVAIAIEMIHTMSLVHDDLPCMDNDDLRRGRATTHKVYGDAVALLSGDALLAEAFGVVSRCKHIPPDRVLKIIQLLSKVSSYDGLAGGQVRDLECEKERGGVSLEELEWVHIHKTAILLEAAVVCGGIVGGGEEKEIEVLRKFARSLGLAYQVRDDILDVIGSTEVIGKTVGKDVASGKATFPSLMGVEKSREWAEKLVEEGKRGLEGYGGRAGVLVGAADFILSREK